MKNDDHSILEHKVKFLNFLFCPNNSRKLKDIKFTIM